MWLRLLPVGLFALLAALLASGIGKDPRQLPSALLDRPAPSWRLLDLNTGTEADSAVYAGRPYVVNVFASWCAGCQIEHPAWVAYARGTGALPVVGLNYKDSEEAARRWLARHGNPYDLVAFDPTGRTGIDFGVYGAPETFFIDRAGIVRHKHVGPVTPELLREWTRKLADG